MSDPITLALIFSLLVGIGVLQIIILGFLQKIAFRTHLIECELLIRPLSDAELDQAAASLNRINPSHPWRDVINQERRQ
jgi:hypothetical protein